MVAAAASSGWSGGADEGAATEDGLLEALLLGDSEAAAAAAAEEEGAGVMMTKKKKGPPSCLPPGFRFHPTDEELALYYLKRKICGRRIRLQMIAEVDVYKCEPWELPEKSILRTGDKQWYFFSPRDRKYPNGWRSNRATKSGYWKATGKDRAISHNSRIVGMKKTLVFYSGRAPKGERTDWVMHEYTMDEQELMKLSNVKDSFALYKVYQKSGPGPRNGEQYGAPFREEEWADDDPVDDAVTGPVDEENAPLMLDTDVIAMPHNQVQSPPPMDELEMLLLQIENGPGQVQSNLHSDSMTNESEVVADTEIPVRGLASALLETIPDERDVWGDHESVARDGTFQISQYASVQSSEILEATSESNYFDRGQGNRLDDFLEICDLGDSAPSIQASDNINDESYFQETDVFFDPYEDFFPTMVLSEAAGTPNQMVIHPYQEGFSGENVIQHEADMTTQLWAYEMNPYMSAVLQPNQGVAVPPPSGTLTVGCSTNEGQQIQQEQGGTSGSWLNSLSAVLINAVPTRPAFASENEFVGRALERVSSFRAGRAEARNQETVRAGDTNLRREGRSHGLLFLSFLVGLGAVVWVLTIGAVVRVLKAVVGRFVP